jgi:Spy/CpxP family protein refolding chaperone
MKNWWLLFIMAVLIGVSAGPASANAPQQKSASVFDNTNLDLTAQQREQIQILRENRWNELKPLRNRLFAKFEELKAVLTDHDPDTSRIKEMKSEIREIQAVIQEKWASYRMALRNILTQEQRMNLKAFGLERGYFRTGINKAGFSEKSTGDARRP